MKQKNKINEKGIGHILLLALIIIVILAIIVLIGLKIYQSNNKKTQTTVNNSSTQLANCTEVGYGNLTHGNNAGQVEYCKNGMNNDVITASPVNLTQIASISKFRSCSGHDFSGLDFSGQPEYDRSMKSYFNIFPQYRGNNTVDIYAPFNGKIIFDNATWDYPNGHQILIAPNSTPDMIVEIFHINLLPGFTTGKTVSAGELIGYAAVPNGSNFDISLSMLGPNGGNNGQTPRASIFDSIFNHMTPPVLSQFQAVGVTPSNIIISKSYRDSNPCDYLPNNQSGGPHENDPFNIVTLVH